MGNFIFVSILRIVPIGAIKKCNPLLHLSDKSLRYACIYLVLTHRKIMKKDAKSDRVRISFEPDPDVALILDHYKSGVWNKSGVVNELIRLGSAKLQEPTDVAKPRQSDGPKGKQS